MAWRGSMARRLFLLGVAAFLCLREVLHFTDGPFLHNGIDTFLDVFCGLSVLLLVANVFGFTRISWSRTIAPCLAALLVIGLTSEGARPPGYQLAEWAQRSPWRGYAPPPVFIDVDPWLSLAADLLVFT